jgi:hypothetical protein
MLPCMLSAESSINLLSFQTSASFILKVVLFLYLRKYRSVILPVVLYGCETWSSTLREERGLMVLENRVLRKTFGSKRDKVTDE